MSRSSLGIPLLLAALATAVLVPTPASALEPAPGAVLTVNLDNGYSFAHCEIEVRSVDPAEGTARLVIRTSIRPTGAYKYIQDEWVRSECFVLDTYAGSVRQSDNSITGLGVVYNGVVRAYAPPMSEVYTVPLREDYEVYASIETRTSNWRYYGYAEAYAS